MDLQQLNDQLRQHAHAEEIQARRQAPEGNDKDAAMREMIQQEVQAALAAFTIQAGQGITVSGTGRNMTIAASGTQQGGPTTGTGVCATDGTIVFNFQ